LTRLSVPVAFVFGIAAITVKRTCYAPTFFTNLVKFGLLNSENKWREI